ncbi:MAG: uracil-DNA glycosylase [Anaerolineaceae bacterium]|nr:uracil-DNA glycosylase [Anaerolineaceae bacterium]
MVSDLGEGTTEIQINDINRRIIACQRCPRLVAYLAELGRSKKHAYRDWKYWSRPVPGFGDPHARLLILGLAPGAHGSNRTGRMFTGDDSGSFLFRALYKAGFANQPTALQPQDGLQLTDVYITAVCRCAPPDNKPTRSEQENCRSFLVEELACLSNIQGIVLLGRIAMDGLSTLYRSQGYAISKMEFSHGRVQYPGKGLPWCITSYHPSRQNTNTGRLTEAMFDTVWSLARSMLVS